MSWISFLIRCDSEPVWPEGRPPWNWIATKDPLHYLMAERPRWDAQDPPNPLPAAILSDPAVVAAGGYQIGAWDIHTGEPHGPVDAAAYEAVRPLGNSSTNVIRDPETGDPIDVIPAGLATLNLRYQQFAGSNQSQLGDPESNDRIQQLYPAGSQPFAIIVGHKYFGDNANPAWDSWGWRAEIVGVASTRDPSAYAVGIYSDADCTGYLYTTGAFTEQESEFQGDGETIMVWATEYNPGLLGQPSATPPDIHHAILLGAAQEGRATLPGGDEPAQVVYNYWQGNQPSPEPEVQFLADVYRTGPQVSVASNDPLTGQQKVKIRKAMRDAGVPNQEIAQFGVLTNQVTVKEAFLTTLACIYNCTITCPPSP